MTRLSRRCNLINFTLIIGFFWLLILAFFHSTTVQDLKSSDYEFEVQESRNFRKFDIINQIPEKFQNLTNLKIQSKKSVKNLKLRKPKRDEKAFIWPKLSDEILNFHKLLNLSNPGHMGEPVNLPEEIPNDIQEKINKSYEIYKINEFVSNLIPLDRDLPDIRPEYCRKVNYVSNLPKVSIIMIFHNEPLSMILRSIFAVFKRTSEELLEEIVLIDDKSTHGLL